MAANIIVINRGDTYSFDLAINDEGSANGNYILSGDDAVYMGIMDPRQPFEFALVKKKITVDDVDQAGNIIITINPEDTLDLIPGKYYYSVKLHQDHDEFDPETGDYLGHIDKVVTIINKTKFIICD